MKQKELTRTKYHVNHSNNMCYNTVIASLQGFPLIFHGGGLGKGEGEANSPFFNASEIEVLVDYLIKLMETQGKKGLPKLSAKDILA